MPARITHRDARRLGVSPTDGDYAADFASLLTRYAPDLVPFAREITFAPGRKWRFDLAWPRRGVAVEIDGGTHGPRGGRHARPEDYMKLNVAASLGWFVLRFQPIHFGVYRRRDGWEADLERFAQCAQLIRETLARPCPSAVE